VFTLGETVSVLGESKLLGLPFETTLLGDSLLVFPLALGEADCELLFLGDSFLVELFTLGESTVLLLFRVLLLA
jgi:hypothetical protein